MTDKPLQSYTRKELAELARAQGVVGWHSMRKDELVQALSAPPKKRKSTARATNGHARPQKAAARSTGSGTSPEEQVESAKYDVGVPTHEVGVPTRDLSARIPRDLPAGYGKDRIVLLVRDPYWLHAYWELTHQAVKRAEAALGQDWHGSRPILRLLEIGSRDAAPKPETIVKDIDIHGGSNNWYIEVQNPPRSYRVDIGYLSRGGQFFVVARSNVVATPRAGLSDVIDENWSDIDARMAERIYAMSGGFDPAASSLDLKQLFEERFRRSVSSGGLSSFGSGALAPARQRKFWFQLDAELIVYGATEPDARVTLQGEPVTLRADGTFTMRFSLPDCRQIIPAVAVSADGIEERTIVLAVERNTKHLEPVLHDGVGE
jgi:hypothetical protein